jgi:acetyl-CoA decarbonylase/synthase complex subunit beta
MRSPKFLQADGSYERIIWLPKEIKESLTDFIPEELFDKIPTEEDASSIKEIRRFLRESEHPVIERLKASKAAAAEPEIIEDETEEVEVSEAPMAQVAYAPEISVPAAGGVRIILKNAKVYAEKVIIKRK